MAVDLDHILIPCRDKAGAAKLLGELLGVPWSATGVGPFAPVYVNDGLTIDFDEWTEPFTLSHFCFRVGSGEFDAILGRIRAANIPFRGNFHGPFDSSIGMHDGGRIVYWNEPDGHQWEILEVSYARRP